MAAIILSYLGTVSGDFKLTFVFLNRFLYFFIAGRIENIWTMSTVSDTRIVVRR